MNPKPDKLMPSLYGGLLIATIWAVPGLNFLNSLCCAGVLLGGFLSVLLYQKEIGEGMEPLTKEDCKDLGIYTGVISAVAAVIIQYIVILAFGDVMLDMMLRIIDKMALEMPAEFFEWTEAARSAERNLFSFVIDVIFMGIINTLFAFLGALIGWKVFRPKPVV
jgi:hypothetical protein